MCLRNVDFTRQDRDVVAWRSASKITLGRGVELSGQCLILYYVFELNLCLAHCSLSSPLINQYRTSCANQRSLSEMFRPVYRTFHNNMTIFDGRYIADHQSANWNKAELRFKLSHSLFYRRSTYLWNSPVFEDNDLIHLWQNLKGVGNKYTSLQRNGKTLVKSKLHI